VRRLAATFVVLAAGGVLATILASASAQGSSSSTFDVIFDDARGLISGQLVKVAGAQAGSIQNVTVVKEGSGGRTSFKAKIEGSIDTKFMPFHTNATCTIRPQGLIAENYLECDPGSPPAPVLASQGGQPPTVPVENTSEPVSLLDLFNIFNAPTRQRFALILNELGIGTAGEGQNFNDILYRANPALKLANQVLGILARQSSQLQTLVDATNTVAQEGASHTGAVQNFLDQAAAVTSTTAAHRSNLELAINRLPKLLAVAQPSLAQLDVVARQGTPLVQQIHVAAPYLNRVSSDLGPFVAQAKPGLAKLAVALDKTIPAIKHVTPVVQALGDYTTRSLSKTQLSGKLYTSLQHSGFIENFLGIVYYVGAGIARFDQNSHLLDFALESIQNGECLGYAQTPVPGCGANYGSAPASAARPAPTGHGSATASGTGAGTRPAATEPGGGRATAQQQAPAAAQQPPAAPQPQPSGASPGVGQLLGGGTTSAGQPPAGGQNPGGPNPGGGSSGGGSSGGPLLNLLNYLLK
jgi:phospholipid/cholesterol/gamma-HCH transport system substrate-binding protein